MSILLLLIPLSIVFATAFLVAFIWAVRSGQYEDTTTPSMRLLSDDVHGARVSRTNADSCGFNSSDSTRKTGAQPEPPLDFSRNQPLK